MKTTYVYSKESGTILDKQKYKQFKSILDTFYNEMLEVKTKEDTKAVSDKFNRADAEIGEIVVWPLEKT